MAKILEIENLQTYFFTSAGTVRAVDGITYSVDQGETVAIVGESGCGKSVSALSILRLIPDPPGRVVGGSIHFMGLDILALSDAEIRKVRGRRIAMVFQEPMTSLNPVLTIGLQLTETLEHHLGMTRDAARARAAELLGMVGISDAERRRRYDSTAERHHDHHEEERPAYPRHGGEKMYEDRNLIRHFFSTSVPRFSIRAYSVTATNGSTSSPRTGNPPFVLSTVEGL